MQAGKRVAGWTMPPAVGTFSNHQPVSDRVLDDFRTIFNAELFQDPSAIGADRFALSDRSLAISVTLVPESIRDMTSYSRSESVSCGARVRSFFYSQGQLFGQRGITYRPPARIFRMAFANSSGALSFVM
jgi:hypothetical protein